MSGDETWYNKTGQSPGVFLCIIDCHLTAMEDCRDKPFALIGSKAKPKQLQITFRHSIEDRSNSNSGLPW